VKARTLLPLGTDFRPFPMLSLDEQGRFADPKSGKAIPTNGVRRFLQHKLRIDPDVTDIFVWVHGWRTASMAAQRPAKRLFNAIEARYMAQPERYNRIRRFKGMYIAISWPSQSLPTPWGYGRIRNRAHNMTENGYAEYFLASLLGYLDEKRRQKGNPPGVLQTRGGQYLHCVGHSFGGRFLAQAIAAAANPSPPTLPLLPKNQKFQFTIDNLLVFQMAAPPRVFDGRLSVLQDDAPLQGPICLTFAKGDRANCFWHWMAERQPGIGCGGAMAAAEKIKYSTLRACDEDYTAAELSRPIVNIDSSRLYRKGALLLPQGSHSDFWYEESIHLLLTLVNYAR
jgi:hypothetical protein